ncbi:hypothetical protein ACFL0V_05410, partial [Nanoarchaeota archaeon]
MTLYRQAGNVGYYQIMIPMISLTKSMERYFGETAGDSWAYFEKIGTAYWELEGMKRIAYKYLSDKELRKNLWEAWKDIEKKVFERSKSIS